MARACRRLACAHDLRCLMYPGFLRKINSFPGSLLKLNIKPDWLLKIILKQRFGPLRFLFLAYRVFCSGRFGNT
jgi:hypothetical protein